MGKQPGVMLYFDIRPRLERDRERYEEISRKRAEAAQARWEAYYANAQDAVQTMPTTTSTPNTNSSSLSTAKATPPDFVQQTDCLVQQIVENS